MAPVTGRRPARRYIVETTPRAMLEAAFSGPNPTSYRLLLHKFSIQNTRYTEQVILQ